MVVEAAPGVGVAHVHLTREPGEHPVVVEIGEPIGGHRRQFSPRVVPSSSGFATHDPYQGMPPTDTEAGPAVGMLDMELKLMRLSADCANERTGAEGFH